MARFETKPRRIEVNVPGFDLVRSTKAYEAAIAKRAKRQQDAQAATVAKLPDTPIEEFKLTEANPDSTLPAASNESDFKLEL